MRGGVPPSWDLGPNLVGHLRNARLRERKNEIPREGAASVELCGDLRGNQQSPLFKISTTVVCAGAARSARVYNPPATMVSAKGP